MTIPTYDLGSGKEIPAMDLISWAEHNEQDRIEFVIRGVSLDDLIERDIEGFNGIVDEAISQGYMLGDLTYEIRGLASDKTLSINVYASEVEEFIEENC